MDIKRFYKQFLVVFIVAAFLISLIFLIYFLVVPRPSCFDGIKNQGEEGVDCGGPCAQKCSLPFEDLSVLSNQIIYIQDNFYTIGVEVRNINQNYGSGEVDYILKAYDLNNNLAEERLGSVYILPNQTKYIIENRVESLDGVGRVEIEFESINWQPLSEYQFPQLAIQGKKYEISTEPSIYSQASGLVVNKSDFDFDEVQITVFLYNDLNQLIGLNETKVNTLLSGEERYFVTYWFRPITGNIASIQIYAETNVFDPYNILERR